MNEEMRRYGVIPIDMWDEPAVKSLSLPARALYVFLRTGPMSNGLGLYYIPKSLAALQLEITVEFILPLFEELISAGCIFYDDKTHVVLIPDVSQAEIGPAMKPADRNRRRWITALLLRGKSIPLILLWLKRYSVVYRIDSEVILRGIEAPLNGYAIPPLFYDPESEAEVEVSGSTAVLQEEPLARVKQGEGPATINGLVKDHPIKDILTEHERLYEKTFGKKPGIVSGKEAAQAKRLITRHGLNEIRDLLALFFESKDPWIQSTGYTWSAFAASVSKLIVQQTRPGATMLTPKTAGNAIVFKNVAEYLSRMPEPKKRQERPRL